jgi:membrane protein
LVFVRFVLFCADAVNDFLAKNCQYIAGAISFYTLFSMFPLFLAITSVLGYLLPSQDEEEQLRLAQDIAEVIPVSSAFIGETVKGLVSARAITGIAGIFGLLWAGTAVFGAIRKGINSAWGIKKTRPFLSERLIDFALVIGAGILLLAVLFSAAALGLLRELTGAIDGDAQIFSDLIWDLVSKLLSPLLSFLTFLILYRFLPNTHVELRDVWPGALLASLAFDGANVGFVWYVKTYSAYNLVYGSVGGILALLTWVYLSATIVLFGALVTSRYARYVSSMESENQSLRFLWTGFSRVRLRILESTPTV